MASQFSLHYCLLVALALGYLVFTEAESIIEEQQILDSASVATVTNPQVTNPANPSTISSEPENPASTAPPPPPELQLIIQHAENPSGLLSNNKPCTNFAFAGQQCSLSFTYSVITSSPSDLVEPHTAEFGYGNSGDNREIQTIAYPKSSFNGFEISGTLQGDDKQEIVKLRYTVPPNQNQGIYTITDPTTGASVRFAWYTAIPVATTTVSPTTKQYESTAYTNASPVTNNSTDISEPTVATTTTAAPSYPQDCDEILGREDGVYTIYLGGDPKKNVTVYCEFGSISGALTVIQSRGEADDSVNFSDNVTQYNTPFGKSGPGNNFWFGLDNMHEITNGSISYNLYLEVCCGNSSFQQRYHNFSISDSASNYTLFAVADTPGVGLDIVALGETGKSDIGASFSTIKTYTAVTGHDLYDCEVLNKTDNSLNELAHGSGGWWFGSCANNLNGQYVPYGNLTGEGKTQCLMDYTKDPKVTGIELRVTPGFGNKVDQTWLDDTTYSRARMAIYRDSIPLQGITASKFCAQKLEKT